MKKREMWGGVEEGEIWRATEEEWWSCEEDIEERKIKGGRRKGWRS